MKKTKSADWYQYLAEEFKLPLNAYTVNDKGVFLCPRCRGLSMVRINHLKAKLKTLGYYECSKCRKGDSAKRARAACLEKTSGINPFALDSVKAKIKKTNLERYGVENLLQRADIRQLGVEAAAEKKNKKRPSKL